MEALQVIHEDQTYSEWLSTETTDNTLIKKTVQKLQHTNKELAEAQKL